MPRTDVRYSPVRDRTADIPEATLWAQQQTHGAGDTPGSSRTMVETPWHRSHVIRLIRTAQRRQGISVLAGKPRVRLIALSVHTERSRI
jgi:hypothetical protein